jgi:hypothetical protein
MIRNIINPSGVSVEIVDLNGLTIGPGETVDGLQFGITAFKASQDLVHNLFHGYLHLHDGVSLYTNEKAVNLLMDNVDQLTKDGKRIITASDRPKDHYRHFTCYGDDLVDVTRGNGEDLMFAVPPGETIVKDIQFIDDIYLKDGTLAYQNAEMGSYLTVEIVAPPNVPHPAIFMNGNFDLMNGTWVPNATNTGAYHIHSEETVFLRFINKLLMLGTNTTAHAAPEPSFLPTPLIHRLTVHNASSTETLKAVISMGLYRKITV